MPPDQRTKETKSEFWRLADVMYRSGHFLEPFVKDKYNEDYINALCMYFSKDPAFNDLPFGGENVLLTKPNLRKGILTFGNVGTGKTSTFKVFQIMFKNTPQSFTSVGCKDLEGKVKALVKQYKDPNAVIDKYGGKKDMYSNAEHVIRCCLFDDFGTEQRVHLFNKGDYIDVMDDILQMRHERYGYRFPTFMTTNLTGKQMREGYSDRVVDRIRSDFNQMFLGGGSWREAQSQGITKRL